MKTLVFRCETGPALGAGHVMRGLALAQEWLARGGRAVFALGEIPPALGRRLREERVETVVQAHRPGSGADAEATAALAAQCGANWVVVDGPMFGAEWDAAFPADLHVLRLDDEALRAGFRADALLNQNLGAAAADYPRVASDTRLLLGPKYALVRREFHSARAAVGLRSNRVLVTLGGTDPAAATERVLAALQGPVLETCEADFIIGAMNPRRDELVRALRACSPRLRAHVSPADLPEMMATAGFAITAGGSTLYELALFGTPMFVLATAENQRRTSERFGAAHAAHFAGWHADLTPEALAAEIALFRRDLPRRTALGETAGRLVDGRGASRVADVLASWKRVPQDALA